MCIRDRIWRVGQGNAVNGLGPGIQQGLGGAPHGGSGRTDIIDECHVVTVKMTAHRETAACESDSLGAASSRLAAQAVAAQRGGSGPPDVPRHLFRQKIGGADTATEATNTVRRDRGDKGDLMVPGSEAEGGREAMAEGAGQLVVTAVLEGQDCSTEHAVVGAPEQGGGLWRRRGDAAEAELGYAVGRHTAARTAWSGDGDQSAAAHPAEAAVVTFEHGAAGHAQRRQEGLSQGAQYTNAHGRHPSLHRAAEQDRKADFRLYSRP